MNEEESVLCCDYLVVGAGTAGMSFIDTMLTEHPSANNMTIVLVDRNSRPGGHWTKAYPYVKLHQPSCYYGVNSLPLGKNLDENGNEIYDVNDRATGAQVLDYYQTACDNFVATGKVRCFFDAEHCSFDEKTKVSSIIVGNSNSNSSSSTKNPNKKVVTVKCRKLVTVATNVTVPSMRKPLIPVHDSVRSNFVPLNDVPSCASKSGNYKGKGKCYYYTDYIVFGNGKSGVDAITHLLLDQGIDRSKITWVVSRDAWYFMRASMQDYYGSNALFNKQMVSANSVQEIFLKYEADGLVGRLDKTIMPEVFKGALVGPEEFDAIRSIQQSNKKNNVVRKGRVVSIEADKILLERGSLSFAPETTLLVDCMVDNEYGYTFHETFQIFGKGRIHLGPEIAYFNPSFSSAIIAFLECNSSIQHNDYDDDDAHSRKNNYCYFLRGKQHTQSHPRGFLGAAYMDTKTFDAVWNIKGGEKFILHSRTFDGAPMHHEGGLRRMAWEWYGPHNQISMGPKLLRKVDSKGYSDVDHRFGIETLMADKRKRKNARRALRCRTRCCCCCFPASWFKKHNHRAPVPVK
jgi:hypothetical protein